jgi:hypothetical protein
MKNIKFSADKDLIARARLIARAQHKTLNAAFREWLHNSQPVQATREVSMH